MGVVNKKGNKGFTMAELLIVVVIIAVLTGVMIVLFNKSVEKSREAYDIYTMRQAASAAVDLYYAGVTDQASALKAGLSWSSEGNTTADNNAYGAYDPGSGKIYPSRDKLPKASKTYGKGTTVNGGTTFVMGNKNGAYAPDKDYTGAVVMIAIYPKASPAHVDVFWKNNTKDTTYVGGQAKKNVPKYCIRINLDESTR